jgi:hypothetical protein
MEKIRGFHGDFNFLNNFYPFQFQWAGRRFYHAEGAVQFARAADRKAADHIASLESPVEAGRAAQHIPVNPDWDAIKVTTMESILNIKFSFENLGLYLLLTGNAILIASNNSGDDFWGVSKGKGRNELGKILMEIRSRLAKTIHQSRPGVFTVKGG